MLHEARVLLANVIHQKATQRQLQTKRLAGKLCDVGQSLIGVSDTSQLTSTLADHLGELGISSCCLAVYDPRYVAGAMNRVRLVLWYRDKQPVALDAKNEFCYESELMSERYLKARHTVTLPLCFGDKKLGVAVFAATGGDGTVYEALRAQTSAALEAVSHGATAAAGERERDLLIERAANELAQAQAALADGTSLASVDSSVSKSVDEAVDNAVATPTDHVRSRLAALERTLNELLETRAQPNTLRAYSASYQGAGDSSAPEQGAR
jgi:hypothetical protein